MDKLQAMNTFVQIADHGSLTSAAEAMDKSLPSVVRVLASLEDSLQVRLFNRTTRRIALTEEGRLYLKQCRRILADVEEAERSLGQHQSEPQGLITITAPERFGEMHVAPAVSAFLKRYPNTRVNLLLHDRLVDLLDEGVDIAVRIAHLPDSNLIAKPVSAVRQVVCASPALLEQTGIPQSPAELSDLPCIQFTGMSSSPEWEFFRVDQQHRIPINNILNCNQAGASLDACMSGVGFGRFLCYQTAPYEKNGRLVKVLSDYEPPALPLSLVYPHARLLSIRVRAMVDCLASSLRTSLGE
ncbi:LysR family transcriptional regulator [Thiomicrorhabdus heinhorstiae]|uniref:LysR family transcriptional regulator n=1 Tax=Thiomicrorhabdus heinhorstiae TaxID=2748010 RepID=A0ABS0BZG8_9GAMM|nr:LysR family transcriptional regulator [Thiomicrorhabdus heinhorstiae]MBF6057497.1 LysR family transcriptional regulator [Thiomicrorhabdus heinhorstiae]